MSKPVALITGGSRGIGLGCATQLALAGFDLAINGQRDASLVGEAIAGLEALGARVAYCQGDIGSGEARARMLEEVRSAFGKLNVLVNNAGVAPRQRLDLLETTEESFDHVLGINLKGPFFLSQLAANWMVEERQADPEAFFAIINIGSISSTVASTNRGEYCVAKAGLSMMNSLFAARLGEYGIPVYEVRPGVIETDMTAGATEKYDELIAGGLCVTPRWGTPEDIGKAVRMLAMGELPYATGQVLTIDGGLTLPRL